MQGNDVCFCSRNAKTTETESLLKCAEPPTKATHTHVINIQKPIGSQTAIRWALSLYKFCATIYNFLYLLISIAPITPKAIQILQDLAEDAEGEWVFVNHDGERLSYEALRYQTRLLCKSVAVPYRGEHVFRHTFATNCYHRGVDVNILSRLLGHADTNITYNIYVHLYGDGFDEMYEALVRKPKY